MKMTPSRRKLLAAMALLTAALGLGAPAPGAVYAATSSIQPTPSTTYVVQGAYYDSGVTLTEEVEPYPDYVNIKISDQSLLRTGWKVKIGDEVMLITGLSDGGPGYPPPPDTMVVYRGWDDTYVAWHGQDENIQGPTVVVDIWAMSVVDSYGLGAFQVYLNFPPQVEPIKVSLDLQWLGSTSRDVWCDGPIQIGSIWSMGCWTLGASPLGPTGSGIIARVRVLPPQSGIATVSLSGSYLLNIRGDSIPTGIQNMGFRTVTCPDADRNGQVNLLDAYQTALQWGDRGLDCTLSTGSVTLSSAVPWKAATTPDTLYINDQSLAWWSGSACVLPGTPGATRPNTIAVDGEIMTAGAFSEGSPDTVAVIRGANPPAPPGPHLAGSLIYLTPSQLDGNYDGKNGYTPARDFDSNGTVNMLDTLIVMKLTLPMQCH